MARRRDYPKYDWRGIAMLTEQLGQLFQPNQLQLMGAKQKHEMNLLMAKKSWDMETKNLDILIRQYDAVVKDVSVAERNLKEYGLGELARASGADGAMPNQTSVVFDKLDVNNVKAMQDKATELRNMKTNLEDKLSNYLTFNEHAKLGSLWPDTFTAKPKEKREDIKGRNYKDIHDVDKSGTLSWGEQNKAVKNYITDYYTVKEGEKGLKLNIGDEVVENVKPEAQAFLAGFQHVRGRQKVEKADKASSLKDKGRPDPSSMTDDYVIKLLNQNNARIEQINNKTPDKTLEEHLDYDKWGDFFAKESARKEGWTDLEIADYVASKNGLRDALKEIRKRPGLNIPVEKLGVKHALSYTINTEDNPSTYNMFDRAKISPDILYAKILMKEKDDKYLEMITSYGDIMRGDAAHTEDVRQAGLNIILNWVNE